MIPSILKWFSCNGRSSVYDKYKIRSQAQSSLPAVSPLVNFIFKLDDSAIVMCSTLSSSAVPKWRVTKILNLAILHIVHLVYLFRQSSQPRFFLAHSPDYTKVSLGTEPIFVPSCQTYQDCQRNDGICSSIWYFSSSTSFRSVPVYDPLRYTSARCPEWFTVTGDLHTSRL